MSVPVVVLVVVGAIALGGGCDLRGAKIVEPRSGRLNPATGTARPDSREGREYETTSMGEELKCEQLGSDSNRVGPALARCRRTKGEVTHVT
jgi:hypothetical protein